MILLRRAIKRPLFCLLATCFLTGSALVLAEARASLSVTNYGNITCKDMLVDAARSKTQRPLRGTVIFWVRGFLSGMNVARSVGVTNKKPVTTDSGVLRDRVEQHCLENPQDSLVTMGTKIYLDLVRESAE